MPKCPVVHLPWEEFKRIQETRNLPVFTENSPFAYLLTLIDLHVCWTAYIFKPTDARHNPEVYKDWETHFKEIQVMAITVDMLTRMARKQWPGINLQITHKTATHAILRVKNKVQWDITDPRPLWVLYTVLTALKFTH